MKSLGSFIIKPEESRYDNQIKIGDKSLITNTKVEDHRSVSKRATVVSIPLSTRTDIKPGDSVIVHHNVFRRFYDVRGNEKTVVAISKMICIFATLLKYICIRKKTIGVQT